MLCIFIFIYASIWKNHSNYRKKFNVVSSIRTSSRIGQLNMAQNALTNFKNNTNFYEEKKRTVNTVLRKIKSI